MGTKIQTVDIVKWIATIIQLIGYGMTGLNVTPYNVYLFFYRDFSVVCCWGDVKRQDDYGGVCRCFYIASGRLYVRMISLTNDHQVRLGDDYILL